MPSHDVDLCEAVKSLLASQTFSIFFQPERVYLPDWDVKKELLDLQVCVFPDIRIAENRSRGEMKKTFRVGIGFAKRLTEKTLGEFDSLMALAQEVSDFIELQTVTTSEDVVFSCIGWEDRARFDPSQLAREKATTGDPIYSGTFLSVTVFSYLLMT